MSDIRFGEFVWPHRPKSLSLKRTRDIKELSLPGAGCVLQDFGPLRRVVTGEDECAGARFREEFALLVAMYRRGEVALLSIPDYAPFYARLRTLDCTRGTGLIRCTFEFWEDGKGESTGKEGETVHIVRAGETLWTIAARYDTTVDTLVAKNHGLRRPDRLTPGERVMLV